MIKDPLMQWNDGEFPYDCFADSGITPASSINDVRRSHSKLVRSQPWTRERRLAWDRLRKPEERLWIDFFLYSVTEDAIVQGIERLQDMSKPSLPSPDFGRLLQVDYSPLNDMEKGFQPFKTQLNPLERITDFDEEFSS